MFAAVVQDGPGAGALREAWPGWGRRCPGRGLAQTAAHLRQNRGRRIQAGFKNIILSIISAEFFFCGLQEDLFRNINERPFR